jgi:hypothetical protein
VTSTAASTESTAATTGPAAAVSHHTPAQTAPTNAPTSGNHAAAHRHSASPYGNPPTGTRVRNTVAARTARRAAHRAGRTGSCSRGSGLAVIS